MCGRVTHLCRCHRNAWKAMKTSLAWELSPPSTPRSADSGIQFILNVMWNQTIKTFLSQWKKNLPILRALSPEFSAHLYHVAATTHIYVLRLHIQIFQQAVGTVLVVLVQRTWMKRTHGCTHLTTSQSYDTHMTYMTYSLHTHTHIYIYICIHIYTYIYRHIYTYIYTYIFMFIYICIYIYKHIIIYTYIYIYINTYI